MALESIANQVGAPPRFKTFIVYNVSDAIDNDYIENKYEEYNLNLRFENFEIFEVTKRTESVSEDFRIHVKEISGYDWYMVHKSDFYLPNSLFSQVNQKMLACNSSTEAEYINFSKFDLREYVTAKDIRTMAEFPTFESLSAQKYACHSDYYSSHKWSPELSLEHIAIGYRGRNKKGENIFDGVMHYYNESARKKIQFNSYWDSKDIFENRNRGIKMEIDRNQYVLHMFHDINRATSQKNTEGHRF